MEREPPGIESADLGVHDCRKHLSIPQHIKEDPGGDSLCARVQQLSKGPPQLVSTSLYQWLIYLCRVGVLRGGQLMSPVIIRCGKVRRFSPMGKPPPPPQQGEIIYNPCDALSSMNQSPLISARPCRKHPLMSVFCSTGILSGRSQEAAGPGGESDIRSRQNTWKQSLRPKNSVLD